MEAWTSEARSQGVALAAACARGDAAAAVELLHLHPRVAVDARFGARRATPLAWACGATGKSAAAEALAQRLVLRKADLDARDARGVGPLAAACRSGIAALALLLLERGAQPNGIRRSEADDASASASAAAAASAASAAAVAASAQPADADAPSPAAALPALPPGWSQHTDEQGRAYYASAAGAVQWERPAATETKGWEVHVDALGQTFYHHRARNETSWEMPLELVPPAWQRHRDSAGREYFYDERRGLTAWERPADFVETDAAALAAAAARAAAAAESEAAFAPFAAPPPPVPPLVVAIDAGLADVATRMVELGADVCAEGQMDGRTPLLAALEGGLVGNGNSRGGSGSGSGSRGAALARVALLLLDRGAKAHPSVVAGVPLLVPACAAPAFEEVALRLLSLGCDANIVERGGGTTPLLAACAAGSERVVRRLLRAGADVNQVAGCAPLGAASPVSLAFSAGMSAVVQELLDAGATDVNCTDLLGRNMLQWACAELANEQLVRRLIERGANPNPTAFGEHEPPLISACQHGLQDAAISLVLARADVNARNALGLCPLGLAAYEGLERTCVALLDAGANVDAVDNHGCEHTHRTCAPRLRAALARRACAPRLRAAKPPYRKPSQTLPSCARSSRTTTASRFYFLTAAVPISLYTQRCGAARRAPTRS